MTRFLDGAEELWRHGAIVGARERRPVIAALGRLLRRLHDAGFTHEDPHIGNFMVRDVREGLPEVLPIDLRRLRRRMHR